MKAFNKERNIFVGGIVLVLIIIGVSTRGSFPSRNDFDSGIQSEEYWAIKKFSRIKTNIVIVGDSRVYRGISPEDMQRYLPAKTSVFNFGLSGGGLNPAIYEMAEGRLIRAGGIRVIVLGVSPHAFFPSSSQNSQFKEIRPYTALTRVLIKYFEPYDVHFLERIFGSMKYFQHYNANGWCASRQEPEDTSIALKSYKGIFAKEQADKTLVDKLIEQVYIWRQKGIFVFALRIPTTKEIFDLEERSSGLCVQDFVDKFEHAGGIWFDAPEEGMISYDGSHLREDSARKVSEALGQFISNYLEKTGLIVQK